MRAQKFCKTREKLSSKLPLLQASSNAKFRRYHFDLINKGSRWIFWCSEHNRDSKFQESTYSVFFGDISSILPRRKGGLGTGLNSVEIISLVKDSAGDPKRSTVRARLYLCRIYIYRNNRKSGLRSSSSEPIEHERYLEYELFIGTLEGCERQNSIPKKLSSLDVIMKSFHDRIPGTIPNLRE